MIYYFDIHKVKVFGPMFKDSGVVQKNPMKGILGMCALRGRLINKLPSGLFYPRPIFEENDQNIIIFDNHSSSRFIKWLCDTQKGKRIIFWYWNPVCDVGLKRWLPNNVERWSFSKADCVEYGMRYNTQFFFDCLAKEAEECRIRGLSSHPKALFLGRDKGRFGNLQILRKTLEENGVDVTLKITAPVSGKFHELRENLLPYRDVIGLVKETDILLDYTVNPMAGMSLRAMEALFFGKKLITNNLEILESDFYKPGNIYVLDHDTRSFREFIDCPLEPVEPEIRDRYLLSNWLKRFDETRQQGVF